jgi:hypothetical protein
MKMKNQWIVALLVSSLFFIAAVSVEAADETITDGTNDVSQIDYLTGETTVVTSSPYLNVNNLDITQGTYTQQGAHVTLTMSVAGVIENKGQLIDFYSGNYPDVIDAVEYTFDLSTSDDDYSVSYTNQTGQLVNSVEQINLTSSDFSVSGNTLSVFFNLESANETYDSLSLTTTYIKANLSSLETTLVYLSDVAPNPPLSVTDAFAYDTGSVGESIQFNATVEPLTGQPPYAYHWDFGDQSTPSAELNPVHTYTKAGTFTYNFTVTDNAGETASQTGTITITQEGGSSGGMSTPMLTFLAILIVIIVIGIIVIVWIIRRR